MYVTGETIAAGEGWVAKSNRAEPVTISVVSAARTSSFENMWLTETPEFAHETEGQVELTFEGNVPAHA